MNPLTTIQTAIERLQNDRKTSLAIEIPNEGDHLVFFSDGIGEREFREYVHTVAMGRRFEELRHHSGTLRGPIGNIFHRSRGEYPSTTRQTVETTDCRDGRSPYERMQEMLTPPEKPPAVFVSKEVLHLNLNVANGTAPRSDSVNREIAREYIAGVNEVIENIPDSNLKWMSDGEVDEMQDEMATCDL